MVSGIWDHWLPVLLAWMFVIFGLGERSMPTRFVGMALAVLATRNWPVPSIVALATVEEIETNILFDRTMIVGGLIGTAVHWIAGAVRPTLRRAVKEPVPGWPPPQDEGVPGAP